ncbi:MAG: CoA transferase [Novosphingobium sp.]|nr:CoA transferase [Novosphingobium sp.]
MSALAGLTIVEIAGRPAGEYTGKLLADFGAEVIKVEPPEGSPTRQMGPFKNGVSALFEFFNTNKKSVVLDLENKADCVTLDRLLARANGLIDDHDEVWGKSHGLTSGEVATAHPHLVHLAVTPFGQGAPAEWQKAEPINVINASGWAYHSPSETPDDKPPLKGPGRFLADYEAGVDSALALLASLHRQRQTGKGQFIDISADEVLLNRIDCVLDRMLAGEAEPGLERTAYDMGGPMTAFACKDGHVYLFMTTQVHWLELRALMGDPDWAKEFRDDWLEFDCTPENVRKFRTGFRPWIAKQVKIPITEAAQKAGVAMVSINTAAELPRNEQFIARGFFQEVEHPAFGKVAYPTVPYKLSKTPVRITSPAPALGADSGAVVDE